MLSSEYSTESSSMYEEKLVSDLATQAAKLSLGSEMYSTEYDKESSKSFRKFYDSIPDYRDINHLPKKEFYKSLENLKQKQRVYYNTVASDTDLKKKSIDWHNYQKNIEANQNKSKLKPFCVTPNKSFCADPTTAVNIESILYGDSKDFQQPPSRRSVRIESPKFSDFSEMQYFRPKSKTTKSVLSCTDSILDDLTPEDLKILNSEREFDTLVNKSISNDAAKAKSVVGLKDVGITIPKPFQMTVRDEENKIVSGIMLKTHQRSKEEKNDMFRANPVPVESQIPLYDKIRANNEKRRKKVKSKRKAALQAQMRPFSFTRREEDILEITKQLPKSLPSLFVNDSPKKIKTFQAKPVPKHLFTNYIYKKMYEDEFYRSLQKKIRAEELLKSSALPPSMAKRDKYYKKYGEICRRLDKINKNKNRRIPFAKEFDGFRTKLPNKSPYEITNTKQVSRCSTENNSVQTSAIVTSNPTNRSNLAAVLRMQSIRKRMEEEIDRKLENARIREETRWRENVMKQRPGWKSINYSHEEDMEIRLQLRRDEERLRSEEHRLHMHIMFSRVNQQPFLFQRAHGKLDMNENSKSHELSALLYGGQSTVNLRKVPPASSDELGIL